MNKVGTIYAPEMPTIIPKDSQWLLGQGAGVWFCISETSVKNQYNIKRFTPGGNLDCDRLFEIEDSASIFDINQRYQFVHVSHCSKCRIIQGDNIFIFNYLKS